MNLSTEKKIQSKKEMKLQFEELEYQKEAVNSVADLFKGVLFEEPLELQSLAKAGVSLGDKGFQKAQKEGFVYGEAMDTSLYRDEAENRERLLGDQPSIVKEEAAIKEHAVKQDETGNSIALKHYGEAKYGVALLQYNGITNPKGLQIGTKLDLPDIQVGQHFCE